MSINPAVGPFNYGDTVTFGPFPKGVNNVDRSLSMGADELVDAVNLDISRTGLLTQRSGFALALAASGAHSLWERDATTALYAAGADLNLLTASPAGVLTTSVLRAGELQPGRSISYVLVNGEVYYSNGLVTGKIRADNTSHPWGVERPARNPVLTRAAGNLPAGWYMVALQYSDTRGESGGMQKAVAIEVPANSSIVVSGIPAPLSADVDTITVYLAEQNGEVLYRYGDYPLGTTTVTVMATATPGASAYGFLCDVPPPADWLEYYNGRIYGAKGSLITYTDALRYGQYNQRSNFIPWHAPVTLLKAVDDGLFVGTAVDTYFLRGASPKDFSRTLARPFGANPGTALVFPKTEQTPLTVGWFSERGFVKGHTGGATELGEQEKTMLGMFSAGAALYREQNGVRQVLGAMRGGTRSAMTSTDFAEAEVRRNGILI